MLAALAGGPTTAQQPARPPAGGPPPSSRPVSSPQPTAGASGRVLYFQKPADSLAATGAPEGSRELTMAPPAELPPIPDAAVPKFEPTADPQTQPMPMGQPGTSTSQKQQPGNVVPPENEKPTHPLPSRRVIFDMYDDATLERAIIQSIQRQNPGVDLSTLRFPRLEPVVPPGTQYVPKTVGYEPHKAIYEPYYVVHRRLHFEEKNTERYGWDLGIIQPFVSTLYFYKDVLLWPNSLASGVEVGFWDTSAGKCLPGSPVPYYLYPPGLTISGMLFEGGIITGSAFILRPFGAGAPFIAR